MRRSLSIFVVAFVWCASPYASAQEARPHEPDPAKPTHGIVRKAPPPKTAESVKAAAPASTEAVAAAIAAAVRSVEEAKKSAPAARPRPPRAPAQRATPPRRYAVRWPSQRLELHWETPDDRLKGVAELLERIARLVAPPAYSAA